MQTNLYSIIIGLAAMAAFLGGVLYLLVLAAQTMRTYLRSQKVREERSATAKSLGEVLRKHRTDCKMTQEFVAETLFVSRQAVSKWESGASDPNTANFVALAKLYGVTPEELMKETLGSQAALSAQNGGREAQ